MSSYDAWLEAPYHFRAVRDDEMERARDWYQDIHDLDDDVMSEVDDDIILQEWEEMWQERAEDRAAEMAEDRARDYEPDYDYY